MKWEIIPILCSTFFLGLMLASCDYSESNRPSEPISYSETDIQNAASCWLHTFDKSLGDRVGDGQCTALARMLTTAPGYGKVNNGHNLGGYDYVKQQQNKGIHIPLLADVKSIVKPCDNLILVGSKFDAAGHTVVVFYPDLANDKIYYLDQNYNGEGIAFRQLRVSENESNTYVISADCKRPINCQLGGTQGPIIAAPQPSVPAIAVTIEAATLPPIQATKTPEPLLDRLDFISVARWVSFSISHNQPDMIADVIGENGTRFLPFAIGAEPLGYNNAEIIINELRKGLVGSSPQCLGYNDKDWGSLHDKAIIIYRGINFDWVGLGMDEPENDMVGFQFYDYGGGWELIWITPMPDFFWSDYHITLDECP